MARTRQQKEELVDLYMSKIKSSKAVFVIEPNKLTANEATEMKKSLYDLDSEYNVVKNSLFNIALEKSNINVPDSTKKQQKGVIFSSDQISESAKIIKDFIKSTITQEGEKMRIVVGFLDGKQIESSQIQELADLPPREVMLAQVLGTMEAPISGFVNVLAGNIRNVVNVINAIKEEKAEK